MSLIEEIKRHEGYSKKVYKDTLGYDTIGIGFLVASLELDEDVIVHGTHGKLVKARTSNQRKLVDLSYDKDMVFDGTNVIPSYAGSYV